MPDNQRPKFAWSSVRTAGSLSEATGNGSWSNKLLKPWPAKANHYQCCPARNTSAHQGGHSVSLHCVQSLKFVCPPQQWLSMGKVSPDPSKPAWRCSVVEAKNVPVVAQRAIAGKPGTLLQNAMITKWVLCTVLAYFAVTLKWRCRFPGSSVVIIHMYKYVQILNPT